MNTVLVYRPINSGYIAIIKPDFVQASTYEALMPIASFSKTVLAFSLPARQSLLKLHVRRLVGPAFSPRGKSWAANVSQGMSRTFFNFFSETRSWVEFGRFPAGSLCSGPPRFRASRRNLGV